MTPLVRGLLLAFGAMVAGGGGMLLAEHHLMQRAAAIESELRAEHRTRAVLVANQPLQAGERLEAQAVALREMPVTYLHASAIIEAEWPAFAGALLRAPVEAGEPLLPSHLQVDQMTRLAELIDPGDRAVTLPVSGITAMTSLLNPGDRVDLMITLRDDGERRTAPLLSDVPIVALGDQLSDYPPDESGLSASAYRDITVAVSPEDAARISQAQAMGVIHLALRGDDDHAPIRDFLVNARTILGKNNPADETARPVEVIIGGRQ